MGLVAAPATEPSTPAAAPSAHDLALVRAAATGKPVEIAEERTQTSTVFANPDGAYTAQHPPPRYGSAPQAGGRRSTRP